jgi:rhodanese-related sulfurtransferase
MAQYLEFFSNHPFLVLSFLLILGALGWSYLPATSGARKLSPLDATRLINHDDAVVIDLRSEGDFDQGHILNSLHIPHDKLAERIKSLEKYRSRPIIATCRTGHQSAGAGGVLLRNGFEKVYYINGGILAWEGASLPLSRR